MRKIAIVNHKGGVGKTTTACNLAAALALTGRRVLLVDLDPQANTTLTMGVHPPDVEEQNILHLLKEEAKLEDLLIDVSTADEEAFHLLPSHLDLAVEEYGLLYHGVDEILGRAIDDLEETYHYHYVIMDGPPSLGMLMRCGLRAATEIIVPFDPGEHALVGFPRIQSVIRREERFRDIHVPVYALLCRTSPLWLAHRDAMSRLEGLEVDRILHPIRQNQAVAQATMHGSTVVWDAPRSIGGKDYIKLMKEIVAMEHEASAGLRIVESGHEKEEQCEG